MRDAGCNVPPWFVIEPTCDVDEHALNEALARLTDCRSNSDCQPDSHCHPELVEGCATTFAVRSSAAVEDSATASYAGQFASLLFVTGDGVLDAIQRVRASAATDIVRAYAGGANGEIAMAVIVQRMVDGEASGVAFGIDPVDGSDVVVVTAAYGLAAGVVDGDCTTDSWRVVRDGTIATRTIAEKDRMHVRAPGSGTIAVAVEPARRARPALDDSGVRAVASLARRIAHAAGAPQDVEFTFAGGGLWALQARPVTAVARDAAPVAIWDDSNIAESYGGVVGALTYSFARQAYAGAYRAFFRLAGVPRTEIDANARTFEALVGRIDGHMMYDLVGWYRMLALLPGYRLNRRLMEEMMGVREALPAALADAIARDCRRGRVRDALMMARTALALAVSAARLPRAIARFHQHVDTTLAAGRDMRQGRGDTSGHDGMNLVELVREYRRLERALLDRWDVPIANDFFVMLSFGVLKRAAAAWCGDASLAPALIAAGGGMTSAEPARAVRELAELDAAGDRLGFDVAFGAYLARFGDRCESELKLESPTLHDDSRPLRAAIARLRNAPPDDTDAATARHRDAERRAHDALRGHLLRAFAFARLKAWARARVVARENLRFERTRVFGAVRRIVVAMGETLTKRGALDDARDVFHLTIDELLGYAEGTAACRDLRGLAAVRRAENVRYAAAPAPPNRFATRGLPVVAARRAARERRRRRRAHRNAVLRRRRARACPCRARRLRHAAARRDPRRRADRSELGGAVPGGGRDLGRAREPALARRDRIARDGDPLGGRDPRADGVAARRRPRGARRRDRRRAPHRGGVMTNALRYAQCWEDADVLVSALAVRPGGTYVAIASAGDNALAMLAAGPQRVIALDREPAQLAALALRVAAYRALSHAELLALMGSRAHADRPALYARCRALLDDGARAYWDARPDAIRAGIGSAGRFERYLALFRTAVLPLIHSRRTVRELLACGDDAERARFYDERWDSAGWRLAFRAFFARPMMSALGREPQFFAHADGPVSQQLLARVARALRDGDAGANPYVRWILTGTHGAALPLALRPESFDAIRANLDRLEIRASSLETFVGAYAGRYDRRLESVRRVRVRRRGGVRVAARAHRGDLLAARAARVLEHARAAPAARVARAVLGHARGRRGAAARARPRALLRRLRAGGSAMTAALAGVVLAVLVGGIGLLARRFAWEAEAARKVSHVAVGTACLALPWLFADAAPVLALAAGACAGLIALRSVPWLRARFGRALHGIARASYGEFAFVGGVVLAFALAHHDKPAYAAAILTLAFGDALAALVGRRFGKHPYAVGRARKSLEGSAAFFVVALLVCAVFPTRRERRRGRSLRARHDAGRSVRRRRFRQRGDPARGAARASPVRRNVRMTGAHAVTAAAARCDPRTAGRRRERGTLRAVVAIDAVAPRTPHGLHRRRRSPGRRRARRAARARGAPLARAPAARSPPDPSTATRGTATGW